MTDKQLPPWEDVLSALAGCRGFCRTPFWSAAPAHRFMFITGDRAPPTTFSPICCRALMRFSANS